MKKKGEIERLFGRSIESIIVHKRVSREENEEQKIYIQIKREREKNRQHNKAT